VFILVLGGSVPIDDLSAWSIDKLLGFLRQHEKVETRNLKQAYPG
jgi:hypothetical protein